jgi:hypothetical protein
MKTLVRQLATKAVLWLQSTSEVARFDGIIIADLRNRKNRTPHFRDTILGALRLLKSTDACRYERVRRRLTWIVHHTLAIRGSCEYRHDTRTCAIDFLEPSAMYDSEFLTGWYASTLVHEATHGAIRSRGVHYNKHLRLRIEQLCVKEQQNFVTRLTITNPNLAERIRYEFDALDWKWHWKATRRERFQTQMGRIFFPDGRP